MYSELIEWEKTIYKNTEFVELKIYCLVTPSRVEANLFQFCFIEGNTLMISKWELRAENKMTAFNTVDQSPAQGDGELYDLKVYSLDNGNECVVIISEMMEFG